ncbi:kinase [Thalictrum thalictroides]|uniref:Kinase n=1 Tax=Thalictrum thalictroides TaxID=46969 RepID=A0A7J6WGN0_THATH|nr:kinase [Thalictrum thalictroides]
MVGKVLGSLKALMAFKDDIQINQRQCCLLVDLFEHAFECISEEMRNNLKFEERHLKWRPLEHPLRELQRIFKEAEFYVYQCLDVKDWWGKVILLANNTDCVEIHIHNLLCCIPTIIEAIEMVGEITGSDQEEMQKKKLILSNKYNKEWKDPKLFQWKFGKQYLITQDICNRLQRVSKEDRWDLFQAISKKRNPGNLTKQEQRLAEFLLDNLNESSELTKGKLFSSSILVGWKDYQVRRRLGNGSHYKEIQWLGESFAVRHFFGEIELVIPEISLLSSLVHPNVSQFLGSFCDEEKKECFLVMELMNKDLCTYIRETGSPRKRLPFTIPVAVDLMLQIARGMEYLHSRKIYHGDLRPSNVLVKTRNSCSELYFHAKISGFNLSSIKNFTPRTSSTQSGTQTFIWYAPEVLSEQENQGNIYLAKYTEKADIYSFGMICFQLLTGKVPFEDSHLQGDKMSRNIRAGERPLFPHSSPKYLVNLTKKCWQTDPTLRPSFSSICRILRYIKKFLLMNPDHSQSDTPSSPLIDYCELEVGLSKKFPTWESTNVTPVSQIPFQMFAYKVSEKERIHLNLKEKSSESGSDGASVCGDDNTGTVEDPFPPTTEKRHAVSAEFIIKKTSTKRITDGKTSKSGTPKGGTIRPPMTISCRRSIRMNSESHLVMSPSRRRTSGHASDSELT